MTRTDFLNDPSAPAANSIKVAVSAVVRDQHGRVLLIHRTDNDLFSIPGGGLEVGETVAEAVVREVKEETGLDVEVADLVGIFSDPAHVVAYDDGEVRQEFSICFRASPIGGELRTSAESKQVIWSAPEEFAKLNMHPSIKLRIKRALAADEGPYFT
ncbi:NUDIX hydrolase [Nocardia takedensis]|uniref:NUDIX hydrolase n=1 Tax=Nocardia takedensis TaxID=259390 RepID=UPI003F758E23